jgi:hypothetical protein
LLVRDPLERVKAMGVAGPEYVKLIPKLEFFFLLPFVYWVLAPLYLPFALVYFVIGYIVYRNQVSAQRACPRPAHSQPVSEASLKVL